LLRLSARFSLMDLPVFLDMLCRGDLSLMGLSLGGSLNGSVSRQYAPPRAVGPA
jgi:esterase/lipase